MTFAPLCLKNQFAVNLYYLLGPNIGIKFHQKSKAVEAYVALKAN